MSATGGGFEKFCPGEIDINNLTYFSQNAKKIVFSHIFPRRIVVK
jgi:hypothetical protein